MNEDLEKLRSIGARKIHEQTHIAQKHVQAILHETFDGMQRVQLMGFISILEREYAIDLHPLRQRAQEYFQIEAKEHPPQEPSYKKELLVSSKPLKKSTLLSAIAALLLLGVGAVLFFGDTQESPIDKNLQPAQQETDTVTSPKRSNESEALEPKQQTATTIESKVHNDAVQKEQKKESLPQTFRIIPKSKVWVGYIDLSTGKKYQKIINEPLELNATKDYLLTFGHGYIDIDVNGKLQEYKDPKNIKFLYQNGQLREIDTQEFKRYNKGKLW